MVCKGQIEPQNELHRNPQRCIEVLRERLDNVIERLERLEDK